METDDRSGSDHNLAVNPSEEVSLQLIQDSNVENSKGQHEIAEDVSKDDASKARDDVVIDDENDDKEEDSYSFEKAPDGGYGWVIVAACFFHHVIVGGIGRSEGLFFLQYQEKFESSAQMTAWPMSLMSTLNFFMGPITGALISRYSVRTTLIISTLLTSLGFVLNGFAPNVYFLYFSTTLLGGLGRGLMSPVLLMNLYFDKHRSLAHGLSSSGVGFGAFALVPIVQWLFDTYGFMGAFLIIGAIELNGLVTAMLFRPLSVHLRFLRADRLRRNRLTCKDQGVSLSAVNGHFHHDATTLRQNIEREDSYESCPTLIEIASESEKADKGDINSQEMTTTAVQRKGKNCCISSLAICFPVEHKKNPTKRAKTFHWHLLKNVPFLVFCFSNTFFLIAFKTAFTFLPAMVTSKGLSKTEAALVLTISGALDTFGRIAIGLIMDIPRCRPLRPYVFNLLLFFIAAISCVIPSLDNFAAFCVISGAYGFMTGAFISQKMVVLVDILGREVMPSSLGISKVFQGIGTLIGPPFAGALRDILGSFDSSFYMGGACMFGSGMLLLLSNVLLRLQKGKQKAKQTASVS